MTQGTAMDFGAPSRQVHHVGARVALSITWRKRRQKTALEYVLAVIIMLLIQLISKSTAEVAAAAAWSEQTDLKVAALYRRFTETSESVLDAALFATSAAGGRVGTWRPAGLCGRRHQRAAIVLHSPPPPPPPNYSNRTQEKNKKHSRQHLVCLVRRPNREQWLGEVYGALLAARLGLAGTVPPPRLLLVVPPQLDQAPPDNTGDVDPHYFASYSSYANSQQPPLPAILTAHLSGLRPAHMPPEIRTRLQGEAEEAAGPRRSLSSFSSSAPVIYAAQWSDLLLLDYVAANLDRAVNNLHNRRWNADSLRAPTHNLHRWPGPDYGAAADNSDGADRVREEHTKEEQKKEQEGGETDQLVLLDNESSLFQGYRLLERYQEYHRALLETVCRFRNSTLEQVRSLIRTGDPAALLEKDAAELLKQAVRHSYKSSRQSVQSKETSGGRTSGRNTDAGIGDESDEGLSDYVQRQLNIYNHLIRVPQTVRTTLMQRLKDVLTHVAQCQRPLPRQLRHSE